MTTITLNGTAYDSADFVDYDYNEVITAGTGDSLPRWQAMFADGLADMGKALTTTSTSSIAIGTGSKTFVLAADRPFAVGAFVTIAETADPTTNYMYGQVTSYTSATTTLVVNVTVTAGSGTIAAWTVQISGARGETGSTDIVNDTTPQLGGNLDVNGKDIVTVSNGNMNFAPHGTGQVQLSGEEIVKKMVLTTRVFKNLFI